MAGIQKVGTGTGQVQQVDKTFAADRASLRPYDYGAFGNYSAYKSSGLIAATLAANSPLFSFRWGDATRVCILTRLELSCMISGAITTAVHMGLEAVIARAFTASDSGGTALTLTGNNNKNKTSMGTSLVTDARIAATAALTAVTRTLDSSAFAGVEFGTGTAVGSTPLPLSRVYDPYPGADGQIVFAQNEGFIVRNPFAGPATGTFVIGVALAWIEAATYDSTQLG